MVVYMLYLLIALIQLSAWRDELSTNKAASRPTKNVYHEPSGGAPTAQLRRLHTCVIPTYVNVKCCVSFNLAPVYYDRTISVSLLVKMGYRTIVDISLMQICTV